MICAGAEPQGLPAAASEQEGAGGPAAQGDEADPPPAGEGAGRSLPAAGALLTFCSGHKHSTHTEQAAAQVLEAPYESQKAMVPFLEHRALRRIVQTFTNDENQDFGKWATNPLVIQMLTQARELLDSGQLTEQDVEQALTAQLQVSADSSCEAGLPMQQGMQHAQASSEGETGPGAAPKISVSAEQLADALNEHVRSVRVVALLPRPGATLMPGCSCHCEDRGTSSTRRATCRRLWTCTRRPRQSWTSSPAKAASSSRR